MQPFEVVVLMAGTAFHGANPLSFGTPPHVHGVPVTIISLPRKVSCGVAIHTAWVTQHRHHGFKGRSGRSFITRQCHFVNTIALDMLTTCGEGSNQRA